jgi:hypothetical protein
VSTKGSLSSASSLSPSSAPLPSSQIAVAGLSSLIVSTVASLVPAFGPILSPAIAAFANVRFVLSGQMICSLTLTLSQFGVGPRSWFGNTSHCFCHIGSHPHIQAPSAKNRTLFLCGALQFFQSSTSRLWTWVYLAGPSRERWWTT